MSKGLSNSERSRIALALAEICSLAGVTVMEVYDSDFETRSKADLSPVSDADERAEAIILERLAREFSGVPVLAEEEAGRGGDPDHRMSQSDMLFLVDPVDGTKEFVQRRGDFTVNIALVERGAAIAGCVFAPARKEMFFGGARAFLNRAFAPGGRPDDAEAHEIRTRPYPEAGLTAVTSSSHLDAQTLAFLERYTVTERTAIGSSLKFCLLASGLADLYPRFGPTMEWDTAAGQAVLEAAGGFVRHPDGRPFTYGHAERGFRNPPFIAWGGKPLPPRSP
jgi:3'(2'), 5'-bisphosphate nucleotidase